MNIILSCEIDRSKYDLTFTQYRPGIWVVHNYIVEEDKPSTFWVSGFGGNLDSLDTTRTSIASLIVDDIVRCSKATSYNDLVTIDENVFYWDSDTQSLYVKFESTEPWYMHGSIRAGETFKYINRCQNDSNGKPTNSDISGEVYKPIVIGNSISDNRNEDKLKDNKMLFSDFSFTLSNVNGDLDSVRAEAINLGARIKKAEVSNGEVITEDDFKVIRNGTTSNVSFPNFTEVSFECSDPRAVFEDKIGGALLTITEYPDLGESLDGKFKPLAISSLTNIPTVKLQETALDPPDASTWTTDDTVDFLIGDIQYGAITSVSNVYLDGGIYIRDIDAGKWDRDAYDGLLDSSQYSVDLATGVITVTKYAGGRISCDCVGSKPESTNEIIYNLLWFIDEFAGIPYLDSFFFTDESDEVIARKENLTGGYYVGSNGVTLKKVVDELAGSINVSIVEKEDKLVLKDLYVPVDTSSLPTIRKEQIDGKVSRSYDNSRYMSSIEIKFNKNWTNNEFSSSLDNSLEAQAVTVNSLKLNYDFESNIDNETDAIVIRDERYNIDPPLVLSMKLADTMTYELYDYAKFELSRKNGDIVEPNSLYRIISISEKNRTLKLRWIEEI